MSTRVLVLGAGMIGAVIARDLAADGGFSVTLADRDEAALERGRRLAGGAIDVRPIDASDPEAIRAAASEADVVAGALPSHLGLGALDAVIDAGRPYCDISFMPEDPRTRDERARAAGVVAVTDFGVAPGMSNVLAAHGTSLLDEARALDIMVGGVPRERHLPFQYKAGFAPADVLEEYTRPARMVEHGRTVVREALGRLEPVEFEGVGTLEAFDTDGLRSLIDTLDVPDMRERTLRWPGHVELMRAFRHAGLMGTEPIEVRGVRVVPRDLLATLLFPQWTFEEGEADLTVMRVDVDGVRGGRAVRLRWDLRDDADPGTGLSSMARTTAFPCAIMVRMIADGTVTRTGVAAPEEAVDAAIVERLLRELAERGVRYRHSEIPLDADG